MRSQISNFYYKICLLVAYQTNNKMKLADFQSNTSIKRSITSVVLMLFTLAGFAQKPVFLEVPVKLEVEKGDLDEVVVKVKKDGKDAFTQSGASKMRFKLDFNKKYSLIFTKPGYITKTIEINTNAPQTRIDAGFEAYKIGVKLYKQGEEENEVVYNQPVAKIKYDQTIDEFNFDTDYSKSILSSISLDKEPSEPVAQAPKPEPVIIPPPPAPAPTSTPAPAPAPIAVKAPEPVKTPEPVKQQEPVKAPEPIKEQVAEVKPETPKPVIQPTPAPTPIKETPAPVAEVKSNPEPVVETKSAPAQVIAAEQPKKLAPVVRKEEKQYIKPVVKKDPPIKKAPAEGTDINQRPLTASTGNDSPVFTQQANSGSDINNNDNTHSEEEKITREDIVEKNRIITRVKVIKGSLTTEYSCVYYKWGGQFYFKNNTTSINENLFVQWTGIRP
jgi:hypothetical protein